MALASDHDGHGHNPNGILSSRSVDERRNMLTLNVLLLGDRQSGRSSVGNALIGGEEFPTGPCISGISMTTECKPLTRNFPNFFRRQGEESDLRLRVIDTPHFLPHPLTFNNMCAEGVHVVVIVVRAYQTHENTHLQEQAETFFGPEWRRHTLLVITHADHLKKAGLQLSDYLAQCNDWLRALATEVEGGVFLIDNSCDWPSIRGRPLREQLLRLSTRNHHRTLQLQTDV